MGHNVANGFGLTVKGRYRWRYDCPHIGKCQHIADVNRVKRCFTGHQYQAAALLEYHICRSAKQIGGIACGNFGEGFHGAGGNDHASSFK